jgi:hypothetical protein
VKFGAQLGLKTFDLGRIQSVNDPKKLLGLETKLRFDKEFSTLICPMRYQIDG